MILFLVVVVMVVCDGGDMYVVINRVINVTLITYRRGAYYLMRLITVKWAVDIFLARPLLQRVNCN